jgi:hypothetical protein
MSRTPSPAPSRPWLIQCGPARSPRRACALATHCPEAAISSFLDSPYGGAFGIDVAQRVAAGDSTEAAVAVVVREWMTHPPTAAEEAALAIPPGLPYLTAIVTAAGMAQA